MSLTAGTDEITTLLEDVGLNLQSMLTSRFVQPFADEVQAPCCRTDMHFTLFV